MADVIVLGPGIGMEDYARCMVENVLKDAYVPIILDADALNLAAEYRELTGYFTENIIVTPHMKEMSRLTGIQIEEMKENPVRTAREFADQYGVVCVLKDAATVIAGRDGKTFVNGSGTPAMAKGGSGDVLTGVIAGLVALGLEESDAAALGVYVHGLAGEAAEKHFGVHGVLAGEIADCFRRYTEMEFDRIYAEVDLGRIEENMKAMKEHLRPGTKMYGVVKTDAYGHGAVPVARTIDRFVCGYAVATVDEGLSSGDMELKKRS